MPSYGFLLEALVPFVLLAPAQADDGAKKGVKLSAPMSPSWSGDVLDTRVTPDGARVVYTGYGGSGGAIELYSVPTDRSSPPVLLSAPRVAGGTLQGFLVSPDGARIVYWADQDTDEVVELYSVPTDGSQPEQRLHPSLAPRGGYVRSALSGIAPAIVFSSDSTRVVYLVDSDVSGATSRLELFSVPADASAAPVRLNGTLPLGGNVGEFTFPTQLMTRGFELSADGTRVVYLANQDDAARVDIYSTSIDGGGTPLRLSPPLLPGENVSARHSFGNVLGLSPDSVRAAFLVLRLSGKVELWSAPLDGSLPAVKLNHPLPQSFSRVARFEFTPDSERVLYLADQDDYSAFEVFHELWSVPADGSAAAVQLNPPLPFGNEVRLVPVLGDDFVLFQAMGSLWRSPLDGSLPALALASAPSGDIGLTLTPDESRAAYHFGALYSVLTDGSAPATVLDAAEPGRVRALAVASDGSRVVYLSDSARRDTIELWSVPVAGGSAPLRLNDALVVGGDVQSVSPTDYWPDFHLTPDGTTAVFLADGTVPEQVELFAVPVDASAPPLRLDDPLGSAQVLGDVQAFRYSPDGRRIVYLADERDGVPELFSLELPLRPGHAPGAPVRISGTDHVVSDPLFVVTADGARVLYRAHGESPIQIGTDLMSASIDGSAPPVRLSPVGPNPVRRMGEFVLTPDGRHVVFSIDVHLPLVPDLWRARVDGSAPPRRLTSAVHLGVTPAGSARLRATGELPGDFAVSADSRSVVYRLFRDGRTELAAVPLAGGQRQILSGVLTPGGSVQRFRLAPDGQRVVFSGDVRVDELNELFSAPLDGSAAPVRLNGPLVGGGLVWWNQFRITPDSGTVLYSAREDALLTELYTAPIDGSAPSQRLSGTLPPGEEVANFLGLTITPDGTRVAFRVLRPDGFNYQVYGVPLDGSEEPVRLNGELVANGGVGTFGLEDYVVTSDSRSVVYRADQTSDGSAELFSVPIDGHAPETRLAAEGVLLFEVDSGSRHAVYSAQHDGRTELFVTPLHGGGTARLNPLVAGRAVSDFRLSPRGTTVVYLADQDQDDVFELFLSFLAPHVAPR